jgi:NAD kinase
MTPKEKAEEIMQKCILSHVLAISNTKGKLISPYVSNYAYSIVRKDRAKSCALIAVDEIINTEFQTVSKLLDVIKKNKIRLVISLNKDYWQEVKQEIEKL